MTPSAEICRLWIHESKNNYHFIDTHVRYPKIRKLIKQINMSIALSCFHKASMEQGVTGKLKSCRNEA